MTEEVVGRVSVDYMVRGNRDKEGVESRRRKKKIMEEVEEGGGEDLYSAWQVEGATGAGHLQGRATGPPGAVAGPQLTTTN